MTSTPETARVDEPAAVADGSPAPTRLRGSMSTTQLVFIVLAFTGSLAVITGYLPVAIATTGGVSTPVVLIALGVMMAVFAVGYTITAQRLPRAGALYTFVTAGLGRPLGLSTSFLAITSYILGLGSLGIFTGLAVSEYIAFLGGPVVPWWIVSVVVAVGAGILGYVRVDFSAKIMLVVFSIELLVLVAYLVTVWINLGTRGAMPADALSAPVEPSTLFTGSVVVAFAMLVTAFSGFESTALYRDEVRRPKKSIPRAAFIVVGVISISLALTSWTLIQAYGGGPDAIAAIAANPAIAFQLSVQQYIGDIAYHVTSLLVLTSMFASLVAMQHVIARYVFNLGVDEVLPRALGRAHPRWGSPYVASVALSAVLIVFLVITGFLSPDGYPVYGALIGLGGLCFFILLTLASLGIAVYLGKNPPPGVGVLRRAVAPIVSILISGGLTVAVLLNIQVLVPDPLLAVLAVIVPVVAVVGGLVVAAVVRARNPAVYARLGE